MNIPRFGVAYTKYITLGSQATGGKTLQANPTLAAGDVKMAKADGAPANMAIGSGGGGSYVEVDADFTKRIKLFLHADDMATDGNISIIFSDQAGDEWCDHHEEIPVGPNIQYGADANYEYHYAADGTTVERHRQLSKVGSVTKKGIWIKGVVPP